MLSSSLFLDLLGLFVGRHIGPIHHELQLRLVRQTEARLRFLVIRAVDAVAGQESDLMLVQHGQTLSQQLQLLLVGKDIFLYSFALGLALGLIGGQGTLLLYTLL